MRIHLPLTILVLVLSLSRGWSFTATIPATTRFTSSTPLSIATRTTTTPTSNRYDLRALKCCDCDEDCDCGCCGGDFRPELSDCIQRARRYKGDFFATKRLDATLRNLPVIRINSGASDSERSSQLHYPIDAHVAARLAAPAATGEGYEKTSELSPEQFEVAGDRNDQWLATIVSDALQGLGIDNELHRYVEAKLDKLLLYEKGGSFKGSTQLRDDNNNHCDNDTDDCDDDEDCDDYEDDDHCDDEEELNEEQLENGTPFATLAIQLPSSFQGGGMTINHLRSTQKIQLDQESDISLRWTAWYENCYHEIEPLTSGHRIVLVYKLVRTLSTERCNEEGHTELLGPWDYTEELDNLGGIVEKWQRNARCSSPEGELCKHREFNAVHYAHLLDYSYSVDNFPEIGDGSKQFPDSDWFSLDDDGKVPGPSAEPEKYLDKVVDADSFWENGLKGRDRTVARLFCAFGKPLRVRFVVQDILYRSKDGSRCNLQVETAAFRPPDEMEEKNENDACAMPASVAVGPDFDSDRSGHLAVYPSNHAAAEAIFKELSEADRYFDPYKVAQLSLDEYKDYSYSQKRVGFLVVELLR